MSGAERIDQRIAEEKQNYIAAVNAEPDRIYLGIMEWGELSALMDLFEASQKVDVPRDEVQGMRIHKVRESRHFYLAGDISEDGI